MNDEHLAGVNVLLNILIASLTSFKLEHILASVNDFKSSSLSATSLSSSVFLV